MAAKDLTSPLIHHIVSIPDLDPSTQPHHHQSTTNRPSSTLNRDQSQNRNRCENNDPDSNPHNPFAFIGSSGVAVPPPPTVDPFRNHTPRIEGLYEVLKMVILLPVALVRLLLFGTCLLLGFLATKLALQGWKDKHNPMPRWRCSLMWVTRVSARCILFSFGYHWIKRKGRPAPRETAPIIVSNHVSFVEPIFYFYELFPTIVASESHDSIPFVGTIIRAMQVIYVNRFLPSSRKHAVNEIKRKASCDRFPRLLLFPEGTTTNGRVLLSFQLGAFIPCYPIQPVIVRYPHVHFDQSWGNVSLARLMCRMFLQFHNFFEVEYLPVVSPLENHKENPVHFAERTGRSIATALDVVQTSHSYGDLMLLTKASQSTQGNPSNYMVEMARVESLFHIRSLEAVDFLDKFLSMSPDNSGRVRMQDFLRVLRLRPCTLSEKIFGFVDVEKIGSITFKQYLYASAHVKKLPLFQQACELAFAQCQSGGNNYISDQQLGDSIRPTIPDMNEDEIRELCKLFNTDGDGSIAKDGFINCLRKNPLLIAIFSTHFQQRDLLEGTRTTTEIA